MQACLCAAVILSPELYSTRIWKRILNTNWMIRPCDRDVMRERSATSR